MENLSNCLFVVGAGAHNPYQMLTGAGLTREIQKLYSSGSSAALGMADAIYYQMLQEIESLCDLLPAFSQISVDFPPDRNSRKKAIKYKVESFLKKFCESSVGSIDSYLSKVHESKIVGEANEFSEVGRLIITYLVHKSEIKTPHGTRAHDWIEYFIGRYVQPDVIRFFKFPPRFITFNYDRILERSIFLHLVHYHHYDFPEALKMVKELGVTHVYGDLGDFSIELSEEYKNRESFYPSAVSRIKVIGEHRSAEGLEAEKVKIASYVESASSIYFLGYGFDSLNNKLLVQNYWKTFGSKRLYSTNFGVEAIDLGTVKKQFGFLPKFLSESADKMDTLTLLKKHKPEDQVNVDYDE